MQSTTKPKKITDKIPYLEKTPEYYVNQIKPCVLSSFTPEQLDEVRTILNYAIPKNSPKIVDFRVNIDLIFSRFYIVLFVGKDRRKSKRSYETKGITRIGNIVAAIILLLSLNLIISFFILLFIYLVKSAVGINLIAKSHLLDIVKKLFF